MSVMLGWCETHLFNICTVDHMKTLRFLYEHSTEVMQKNTVAFTVTKAEHKQPWVMNKYIKVPDSGFNTRLMLG